MKRKFSKQEIISAMENTGMIPVFFHADPQTAKHIVDACYEGGVRVFEFTNRGENAGDVFSELVSHISQYDDACLGMGTIMTSADTKRFIETGADFIVSPILKLEMAGVCREQDVPWIPGCGTLTEIVTARENGADVIKVFPGSVIGPAFVSAVLPVVPGLKLMPTGGIDTDPKVLESWFQAGVVCVGMGSQLLPKKVIAEGDWKALAQKVKETLEMISRIRASRPRSLG